MCFSPTILQAGESEMKIDSVSAEDSSWWRLSCSVFIAGAGKGHLVSLQPFRKGSDWYNCFSLPKGPSFLTSSLWLHHHLVHQDVHLSVWRRQRNSALFCCWCCVWLSVHQYHSVLITTVFCIYLYIYVCVHVCVPCCIHGYQRMTHGNWFSPCRDWTQVIRFKGKELQGFYFCFKVIWLFGMLCFSCRNFGVNLSFSASQLGFHYQLCRIYRLIW